MIARSCGLPWSGLLLLSASCASSSCVGDTSPSADGGSLLDSGGAPLDAGGNHGDAQVGAHDAASGPMEHDAAAQPPSDAGTKPASATASAGCGKSVTAGMSTGSVQVGANKRTYVVVVPGGYDKSKPGSLFFAYHGSGGNGAQLVGQTQIEQSALTVFPDGLNGQWTDADMNGTDALMFDAVLKVMNESYCFDTKRVFTAGFSWGGWMASSIACWRGGTVRGFASIEGGTQANPKDCKAPVAAWINHFDMDPAEPLPSGEHTRDMFLTINGASNPSAYDAPNPCTKYTGKAPVVFCKPSGGYHAWPGYATPSLFKLFDSL
ncbi:MAG: hypothetical protein QM778_26370 [Myxococcales bacterium]